MQSLAEKLRALIHGVPPGGSVTLPREAVEAWLTERGEEGGGPSAGGGLEPVADLTVPMLAEELDRSVSTVRGWMPDIPGAYKLGTEWRVSRADWRAHLRSLQGDGDDGPPQVRSKASADLGNWRNGGEA